MSFISRPSFSTATLGLLLAVAACAPARREPNIPRILRPEGIEVTGGSLGRTVLPVPEGILGAVLYDLPVEANTWVESEMSFLLGQRRETMARWMERADFYEGFVKSVFREYGIPTDLIHLGMIESGFIPTARSSAGAVGIWQFMPATGREANLRVDETVDERMDPVRSTRAAASHLRSLYRIHGDWALAAAAYNAGSGRISRGLDRFGATNFWDLATRGDLAQETQHYVPRLYAATIIARDRNRFGFERSQVIEPFAFDSILVDLPVSLGELSEMSGVDGDVLSTMNPHFRRGAIPVGGYWVWVPAGSGPQAQRMYVSAAVSRERMATYTVRWGDSLGRIAQRSGVSSSEIRNLNRSINFDRLLAGAEIQLPAYGVQRLTGQPAATSSGVALSTAARVAPAETSGPRTHTVGRGDTLSEIARDYGVTVAEIQRANSLGGTVIRLGQRLTVPASSSRAAAPIEHVVVAGDTLWDLARRYGTSIAAIEAANGLGSRPIIPGQRLTMPVSPR